MKVATKLVQLAFLTMLFFYIPNVYAQSIISTYAGSGIQGNSGDGALSIHATLNAPDGVALDDVGNLYIADEGNVNIRKVDVTTGIISTIAGNGFRGYAGDSGLAINAEMDGIWSLCLDHAGNVYFADENNNRVRKIDVATGIITTVAGDGTFAISPDGGLAVNSSIWQPLSVCLDDTGNLYIAEGADPRIRKVSAATGIISTVAGTGSAGFSGDGGLAINAKIGGAKLAIGPSGNLYIADPDNDRVRMVDMHTGIINTIAGNGTTGMGGNNGPATSASLWYPVCIAVDKYENIYIGENNNDVVRKIDATSKNISIIAGSGAIGYSGDGGTAINAALNFPASVAIDNDGNLYIADVNNYVVRQVNRVFEGIKHIPLLSIYDISPNPSSGKFLFKNTQKQLLTITVCNTIGEEIYRSISRDAQIIIDLNDQPRGVYFAQISSDHTKISQKLVLE